MSESSILKVQGIEDKRLGIHYEVDTEQDPIGVGGMGQVYKGVRVDEHTGVRQPAAIKFLFDDLSPNAIERSRREASIRIDNENLLKMFGFIEMDGHYHVASELLYGVMLSDLLTGVTTGPDGKPIELAEKLYLQYKQQPSMFAREIVKCILSGVMALHDKGYIHRDIDPSNIMITADGKVKLIDFGIAKQMTEISGEKSHLTPAGQFMGKAAYASPELVLGDVAHENATTDLYAVGIVLFQLLTGKLPFDGPRQEILEAQLKTPPPLSQIKDRKMRRIVARSLAKKQSDRYQSAAEFRAELEQTVEKRNESSLLDILNGKLVGSIAAAVVVLVGGIIWLVSSKPDPSADNVVKTIEESAVVRDTMPSAVWYTEQAIALLKTNQFDKGVDYLNKAIQKDSASSAMAYAIMASLYSHEGACKDLNLESHFEVDYRQAYEYSSKAVQLDSTCYYAHYELGYSYGKRLPEKDKDKAFWHLRASKRWAEIKGNTSFADQISSY